MAKTPPKTAAKKPAGNSAKKPAATRGTPPPKPGRPQLRLPTPKTAAGKKVDPLRLQKVEAAAVEATRERHQQGGDATVDRRHLQRYPIDDSIRDVKPHNWATADRQLLEPDEDAHSEFTSTDPWRVLRIMGEYVDGFDKMASITRGVSIFGSARTTPDDPHYAAAVETARLLAYSGFDVITGGGPGIMEAANRGAVLGGGRSFGCNIELPFEQQANPFVTHHIVHHLSGRLRHVRRDVRGADADPDGQDLELPGDPVRQGVLGGAHPLAPLPGGGARQDQRGRPGPADPH
jgi:hypothetical protein